MPTIALFKPYDVLTKFTDAEGRPTLADYVNIPAVYPAGRLDKDSEGLLLLTDDRKLARFVTDPQHEMPKVYLAQVENIPDEAALQHLRDGVIIQGTRTRQASAELLLSEPDLPPRPIPIRVRKEIPAAWIRITLHEGRNRQVRRMTAAVGYPTLRLVRVAIGPIQLGDLLPGEWRFLSDPEVRMLWRLRT
jgi:23S rRNA pseudouridine2457 synthase